jgi:hypothetical protein
MLNLILFSKIEKTKETIAINPQPRVEYSAKYLMPCAVVGSVSHE